MVPAAAVEGVEARARKSGEGGDIAPFSVTRTTSSDIEEQAASLREWDQVYEQMTPGRFVGGLHEMCFAGIQVFRESTNQAVHEAGAPWTGSRAIGVPVRMDGTARFRGEPVDVDALVTLGAGDELDFYTPRGFEIFGLVVDEKALEAHARQVEHRDLGAALAGKGVFKPGTDRLSEFRRLLMSVIQSLDANPVALQYRQTQSVLAQTMLGAVVAVVADEAGAAKTASACAGRHNVVDAAKAFMRSRIAEPITVADLCRELGVSRRTLQYSFQEVLGINPVAFLRAMRLNGVRRDLKVAQRPADSVQDIAARWGFWHLGHFVTDYKRMFGELPSETLRGRRRAGGGRRR
ncbi:MAG: helix-turn-helix domain-containing protein [Betaproteobacteria bacterium]|nr:helix-turn-helix domain-containing protein [Betaproteobacteria bacterium]